MKNKLLAEALRRDGRTQRDVARAAGVDAVTLSLSVNGRRVPRIETALRIAHALGTTPESIGLRGLPTELRGGVQ